MSYVRDFLARKLRDPQAKFIHDLAQEQINNAADNSNKITTNKRGYSLKTRTKTTSKDKFYANIKPLDDSAYYTGQYPDLDNCRLFLYTENSDKLHDYSLMNNKAYAYGTRQVSEIYQKEEPNNIAKHEYTSYYNGTHYVIVKDNAKLRLEDIVANEPTKVGFTIVKRFNPLKYGNSVQDSQILVQKTDSSSNKYGYSINMDESGSIYFYVHYNYRQYFCKLTDAFTVINLNANFFFQNFKSANFKTEKATIESIKDILYDLVCQFNFTTKECKIIVRGPEGELLQATSIGQLPSNLQLNLPLQEGKWSGAPLVPLNQVYDVANNIVGTINNPTAGEWGTDNTLTNPGGSGTYITFPSISAINTMTEFSMSFWYNPLDELVTPEVRYLTRKLNNVAQSFAIFRDSGQNNIRFVIWNTSSSDFISATFPNAFPTANTWYFITAKWKSGEKVKISVNNAADVVSTTQPVFTFTNAVNNLEIFRSTTAAKGKIINYMFFTKQLSASEQTALYELGPHLAQFPKNLESQRLPDPAPGPITNPFSTLYDLPQLPTPVLADYTFINNVSAANPFTQKYTCAVGTPEVTQEQLLYDVNDGAGGPGSPFVVIQGPGTTGTTIESSDSSNGILGDVESGNRKIAVRIKAVNAGIGLGLVSKIITKAQWDLKRIGTVVGTVYCKIWNAAGNEVATIGSLAASSLTTEYALKDFVNTSNTVTIPSGSSAIDWRIGLEYTTGDSGDEVQVRRKSGNIDSSVNQDSMDFDSSSWNSNGNDSFEVKCNLFTGLGTTSSDPNVSLTTGSYDRAVEQFGTGDPLLSKIPTKVILRLKKTGSPTGTGTVRLRNTTGSIDVIIGSIDVSTLTTSTADYTFTNLFNNLAVVSGYQLGFFWSPSASGSVQVMSNVGTTDPHNGTASFLRKFKTGTGSGWQDSTSLDLSGKIYIGGQNFTAARSFSPSVTRIYQRALNSNASHWGQKLTRIIGKARRTGTIPAPSTLNCVIRRQSDNTVVANFGGIDANTIPTGSAWNDVEFSNVGNNYIVANNDYVSFELASADATNFIEMGINKDVVDTSNSISGQLNGAVYEDLAQFDVAGTFYIGGQPDAVSRTRVGQYINTQNSLFITAENNKETEVTIYLIKQGTPSGTVFINIRTGEDDSPIKTLGSVAASGLSAVVGTPTAVTVTDTTNSYVLKSKDLAISVEFNGGDQNNKVGIMVRTSSPNYDASNSYLARYNGILYDYDTTKDVCAKIRVGGDTYTPEANEPPPNMPQLSTDLYIGVKGDKTSMYEKSMHNMFMFTTEILTMEQLEQLHSTRLDIEQNSSEEILVTNYSFIRDT